jgi:hypothetical protein
MTGVLRLKNIHLHQISTVLPHGASVTNRIRFALPNLRQGSAGRRLR